ncbi:long-chain-acyl-CoA synthetase [Candidatus Phycosocius spiralis]|uniref:Long-chain-acyl-CoA synthetase n=2 Tax=Candidatus Phycosocius spiralis TaxID=2815099 RepID=A0ABQ4PW47_9PROT|nr:long-chain-acyl-CoA synthetase [Candidatus Phycosocius spiralis]
MGLFSSIQRELTYISTLRRTNEWIKDLSPESTTLLPDHWESICDQNNPRPAIIFEGKTWTYGQLDGRANLYAHWAISIGLKTGDVVALFMQNRPDYLAAWYGLAKVGVIVALINHNLQGPSLLHCITIAKSKAAIIGFELADLWASVDGQLPDVSIWSSGGVLPHSNDLDRALNAQSNKRPSRAYREMLLAKDPCLYVYTSGTTGNPKAACLSHARTQALSRSFIAATKSGPNDRVYCPLPIYHATGGICAVGLAFNTGATLLLRRRFSATQFWDDIVDQECTIFAYIGEMFRYLVSAPIHPKERSHKLKSCFGNGLRQDVWARAQERFKIPLIVEFYGSTEGNVGMANIDGKLGAVGRIPSYLKKKFNVELVRFDFEHEKPLRNEDGFCERCGVDEVGEAIGRIDDDNIRARFDGYANDRAGSDKKLLRDVFEYGDLWFRTGDLLRQDKLGYFYFVDRIGDTYRWKSENVSTNEVGEVLCMFPGIDQANVYGVDVPHTDGRAGMAVILASELLDLEALSTYVRSELPGFAVPVFLRFQPEMDITGTFKYRKLELVNEGFNPSQIHDPIVWMNPDTQLYEPLTAQVYDAIQSGHIRF